MPASKNLHNSGRSPRRARRPAIRPIEASKAAITDGSNTSTLAVPFAHIAGMAQGRAERVKTDPERSLVV